MSLNKIAKQFESYSKVALPEGAPPQQHIEVQKAFYAGAVTLFAMVLDAADLEEDAATAVMEALQYEVDAYVDTLRDLSRAHAKH